MLSNCAKRLKTKHLCALVASCKQTYLGRSLKLLLKFQNSLFNLHFCYCILTMYTSHKFFWQLTIQALCSHIPLPLVLQIKKNMKNIP